MPEPLDTSGWKRLHPKVQTLWRLSNLVATFFAVIPVGFLAYGINQSARGPWWVPLAAVTVLLVAGLAIGQAIVGRSYDRYRFALGEEDLAITKGVFWRSWRFISRNRIQHLDITAGPISRALGLVQVTVFVGGMHHAAATIPGLTEYEGEELRARLVTDRSQPAETPPPLPPAPPEPPRDQPW